MKKGSQRRFWSNILAVAYKEATILRHDKALIAMLIAQPVMMMFLFGVALSNEPANVPWAVLDQSQTELSRRLVQEIEATGYFLAPRSIRSYDRGHELLANGKALAFLVVPRDFRREVERGRPEVQLFVDGSDPLSSARVAGYVAQVGAAFDIRALPEAQRAAGPLNVRGPIDTRQQFWFNPTLEDRTFFLAAMAGMLLTNLCLSITSLGIVAEREAGTYEFMLAQPTTPTEIILGKLLPYVGIAYALFLGATLVEGVVFGVWPVGSWVTLSLVTLPFILASLAIGTFVSALARTSAQAVFITVFFILPSFVLSGAMFPYQFMPHGVRELGDLLPLRWYQIASRRIIERGAGLEDIAVPFFFLTASFVVMLTLVRWRMRPRLG
jgi:ABC-2 type transport system permease protein